MWAWVCVHVNTDAIPCKYNVVHVKVQRINSSRSFLILPCRSLESNSDNRGCMLRAITHWTIWLSLETLSLSIIGQLWPSLSSCLQTYTFIFTYQTWIATHNFSQYLTKFIFLLWISCPHCFFFFIAWILICLK